MEFLRRCRWRQREWSNWSNDGGVCLRGPGRILAMEAVGDILARAYCQLPVREGCPCFAGTRPAVAIAGAACEDELAVDGEFHQRAVGEVGPAAVGPEG